MNIKSLRKKYKARYKDEMLLRVIKDLLDRGCSISEISYITGKRIRFISVAVWFIEKDLIDWNAHWYDD